MSNSNKMKLRHWLDIKKPSHASALRQYAVKGKFPDGFLPEDVEHSPDEAKVLIGELFDSYMRGDSVNRYENEFKVYDARYAVVVVDNSEACLDMKLIPLEDYNEQPTEWDVSIMIEIMEDDSGDIDVHEKPGYRAYFDMKNSQVVVVTMEDCHASVPSTDKLLEFLREGDCCEQDFDS